MHPSAMASPAIIPRGTAYHFREELTTGFRRTTSGAPGAPLTEAEITERMEALQARAETLGTGHRERELAKLQELEQTVLARAEELKKKADAHHAEAMQKAEETSAQVESIHLKVDKINESGADFLRALDTGKLPPRPEGQSDAERLRFLRGTEASRGQRAPGFGP